MNKFFIFGAPRTGTTALAKTLDNYNDIYMYRKISDQVKDNETELFEPFATFNSKIELDWEEKLAKVEKQYVSKYNGFKLITGDTVHPVYLVKDYGYDPIIIIRKNIWKALFSKLAAIYSANNNNNSIDVYANSSKDLEPNFNNIRHFIPRLLNKHGISRVMLPFSSGRRVIVSTIGILNIVFRCMTFVGISNL